MEVNIKGIIGEYSQKDGDSIGRFRYGHLQDLIVSELHGQSYEQAIRKRIYTGAVVGQVTTVGLAATYTGLCLSNPSASGVSLAVRKVGIGFTVAFAAAAAIGLMTGFSNTDVTQTVAVTPRNRFIDGKGAGKGLLSSSATLQGTPLVDTILGVGLTGAITTVPSILQTIYDLQGGMILQPGAWVAVYTSTASGAAGGNFSFEWEENPLL